jgi:cobaltochelatase CobT
MVTQHSRTFGRRIDLAWEATISLALALEGIHGVNVGISAFPGKDGEGSSIYTVLPHGYKISQRVDALGCDLDGSTPLAEALWFGASRLLQQREDRKLLFVLTDGIPDDVDAAMDILQRCQDSGIEVTGVGLGIDVERVFESACIVQDVAELPIKLNLLCRDLLMAA